MKKTFIFLGCLLLFISCTVPKQEKFNYVAIEPHESLADIVAKAANVVPTERQLRWQKMELTAFLHFGMNTFTNREWGDGTESPQLFNPTALDANQWVRTLKEAGFKQLILTAKHHDGFCLWPTATTTHSVKSSPWKEGQGDVVREVADACRAEGMGFGVYLSPWDRNASCYGTEAYNDFFVSQLTELLTQYGTVHEVWFDGACGEGPNGKKQEYDFVRWYQLIRTLQPQAVIAIMGPDVRWVGTESGKGRFSEWSVIPNNHLNQATIAANSQQEVIYKPMGDRREQDLGSREKIASAKGLVWYPAETDVSIRPGWFYHTTEDGAVKTPQRLMDIYFTSVGMNGLLLLNIPPDTRGLIHPSDVASLQGFKALREEAFGTNLAKGARMKCKNGKHLQALLDGQYETHFTTTGKDTTAVITLTLPQAQTFNVLGLQEDITVGQRVEAFRLEYLKPDGQWQNVTEGTTIGYKRLLRFQPVTASTLRFTILSSRLNPALSEFGLYNCRPAAKP